MMCPLDGPPRGGLSRGRGLIFSLAVLVLAMAVAGYIWQPWAPRPPAIDTAGVDPGVVEAVAAARDLVRQAPFSSAAWGRLGMVFLANEYYVEATACLRRAEELDPREPRWPYLLAMTERWVNQDTVPKLERAVELVGNDPPAVRLALAEAYLAQGRTADAETHFQHLLQSDPAYPWAHLGLACAALAREDPAAAIAYLDHPALALVTPLTAHTLRAAAYQRLGNLSAADAEQNASRGLPNDPPAPDPLSREVEQYAANTTQLLQRADGLLQQRHPAEAYHLFEQITQVQPDRYEPWLGMGRAREQLGDIAGAEAAFRKGVAVAPQAAAPHYFLGLALLEQGQTRAAAASFQQTIALKPNTHTAYSGLSRCLHQEGDLPGAIAAARKAVQFALHDAGARVALGELLIENGQGAEAVACLQDALRVQPENKRARTLLAKLGRAPP